ncbi:hypothetical protein L873DRAFT_1808597, partial [Choiromyces venosus 120613-1]
ISLLCQLSHQVTYRRPRSGEPTLRDLDAEINTLQADLDSKVRRFHKIMHDHYRRHRHFEADVNKHFAEIHEQFVELNNELANGSVEADRLFVKVENMFAKVDNLVVNVHNKLGKVDTRLAEHLTALMRIFNHRE